MSRDGCRPPAEAAACQCDRLMSSAATSSQGVAMKKFTLFVMVMAVLAFGSSTVFAGTYSTYASWTGTDTPHTNYTTTSIKCAVCHAVHKAEATGQVLLRTTVADACTYCHIISSTGNIQVYGGESSWYSIQSEHAHNTPCTGCHAVHGADTITDVVADKILKNSPGGYSTQSGVPWGTGDRDEVVSTFCSACHPYYVGSYEATHAGSWGVGTYKGHIMTADYASYDRANVSYTGSPVAWASSFTCRDCHDAGSVDESGGVHPDNFPHYTTGLRFLKSADSAASPSSPATVSAVQNGVCLKCHRQDSGTGIGLDF